MTLLTIPFFLHFVVIPYHIFNTCFYFRPIFLNQYSEHMKLMNANGGMRFTDEFNVSLESVYILFI